MNTVKNRGYLSRKEWEKERRKRKKETMMDRDSSYWARQPVNRKKQAIRPVFQSFAQNRELLDRLFEGTSFSRENRKGFSDGKQQLRQVFNQDRFLLSCL